MMDSPGGQGKHIVTEEQFRNFYPDVSIQPSIKATLDVEKRLAAKSSPTKAAVVMTKTPVAAKSQATPKSTSLRTTNSVAAKANSPMVAKSPAPVTPKSSAVTKTIVPLKTLVASSKVPVVCNSPAVTTGRSVAVGKAPVNKPAVVVKTPAAPVKTPVPLASPVTKTPPALRASSVKLLPPTSKLVATTPTLSKTPQSVAKPQQTSSVVKIQTKPAVMAVLNKDGSEQSTITILNFSVPSHPSAQRSSNQ